MTETDIGHIKHYFDKLGVAIVHLDKELSVGDRVRIQCQQPAIPFVQKIESMQIDKKDIPSAKSGDDIGLKTLNPCKDGDRVIRLEL